MLLNLNNCSVLKPQGYSPLQSISESEHCELKNTLTFVFCWVEKLVLFFWTSPGYPVCWKSQGLGLVNQKVSSSLSGTEISPFPAPPNQSHGSTGHSHLPHVQMQDYFSAIPHVPDKGLCFLVVVFSLKWRESWDQPAGIIISCVTGLGTFWSSWNLLGKAKSKDGTARHESGAGHNKNPERTISILPNTSPIK